MLEIDEQVTEQAPWRQDSDTAPPLAWSAIGDYTIGEEYVLTDIDGEVILRCHIRSFEIRAAGADSSWAQDGREVWAALDCPIETVASVDLQIVDW